MSKLHLKFPVISFCGIRFFFVKTRLFSKNTEPWAKHFRHPIEYCVGDVKATISVSGGLIWQTLVVSEKQTYFITNSDNEQKTFGIFSKIFRQGCQNCLLRLNRETNRTIIFSGKVLFSYRFLPMSKKFPAFCHEFPEGVVKKDFQNSIGSFWQKILFFFRKKKHY